MPCKSHSRIRIHSGTIDNAPDVYRIRSWLGQPDSRSRPPGGRTWFVLHRIVNLITGKLYSRAVDRRRSAASDDARGLLPGRRVEPCETVVLCCTDNPRGQIDQSISAISVVHALHVARPSAPRLRRPSCAADCGSTAAAFKSHVNFK